MNVVHLIDHCIIVKVVRSQHKSILQDMRLLSYIDFSTSPLLQDVDAIDILFRI